MKKTLIIVLFLLFPVFSFAQSLSLFTKSSEREAGEMKLKFSAEVEEAQFLNVNKAAVDRILNSNLKTLEVTLPLETGAAANLKLSEYNILTDNAIISMMTNEGEKTFTGKIPFRCFKGIYNNDASSLAVICISEYFVKGILLTENSSYTLSTFGDKNLSENCVLYQDSKLKIKNDFHCGSEAFAIPEKIKTQMQNLSAENVSNTFLQANIALEIDKITYATYGSSVPNASASSLALLSVASAIYNRDINVKLNVPYIHVWTTTDPYTGTTSGALLDQFVDHWNANFSSVNRTLAHFLTRRTGGLGGIAYLDVLCDSPTNGNGYGFSNIAGAYSQLPVYSWDVMVVAHELGHNFGSPHTFNCNWPGGPIDTCYRPEGNCFTGSTRARVGTIMSYCHLNGSIDLRFGFGPLPKALIRTNAENAPCISAAPEQLLLSYPQGGEIFATSSQQYIYWGTSSTANMNIDLTTNNGISWSSLGVNVPAQQHYFVWTVPYIPTAANCKIKIYDAANPAFADTVNGVFTIKATLNNISLVSPANGASYFTTFNDTSKVVFSWTSSGTLPAIKYKWKIRRPGGAYVPFTADSNGSASRITIAKSKLDSIAAYTFGLTGDSIFCGWIATAFINSDSVSSEVRSVTIRTNTVSVNSISSIVPVKHRLHSNYPNPFNPVTKIKFEIPKDEFVKITVFDLSGKEVSSLVNEKLKAGIYEASFNAASLASGTYFYKIETSSYTETRKMVLLK